MLGGWRASVKLSRSRRTTCRVLAASAVPHCCATLYAGWDRARRVDVPERSPETETINASEARRQWSRLVNRVFRGETRILIEKSGIPVAAIISAEDLQYFRRLEAERLGADSDPDDSEAGGGGRPGTAGAVRLPVRRDLPGARSWRRHYYAHGQYRGDERASDGAGAPDSRSDRCSIQLTPNTESGLASQIMTSPPLGLSDAPR